MNTAKIAAALHALADAFLEGGEASGEAVAPSTKKGGKKTSEPAAAAVTPTIVADATPTPVVPSVTITQVNKAVLAVAAKNRDGAVAILAKFGLANTVGLPQEKWQAVYDAFEEEIAKQDAAAVQVAQASLV